jgi:hypothetical protein
MNAGRVDVSIEIGRAEPSAVLRCRRCGAMRNLLGPAAHVAADVAEFTDTHLDCPLVVDSAAPTAPSAAER